MGSGVGRQSVDPLRPPFPATLIEMSAKHTPFGSQEWCLLKACLENNVSRAQRIQKQGTRVAGEQAGGSSCKELGSRLRLSAVSRSGQGYHGNPFQAARPVLRFLSSTVSRFLFYKNFNVF